MRIEQHIAAEYADVLMALLPPGPAWEWQPGGYGAQLYAAAGQELARLDTAVQAVTDMAIERHRPKYTSWTLQAYRNVANAALNGLTETMPRKTFAAGSHAGDRLWSASSPATTFPVKLVQVDHLVGPFRAGSHAGDRLWGHRSRYILRVRYYRSVVNPKVIWDALMAFKQAHVYLWFEDITGVAGEVSYAQN